MNGLHERYGGYGSGVEQRADGTWYASICDFGPNTIFAGEGATREEAIKNITEAKWGYKLRHDFLRMDLKKTGISKGRQDDICRFLSSLTHEQKNMIVEIVEACKNSP